MKRLILIGLALSVAAAPWAAPSASARDQGDLGAASPSNREIVHEFPTIPSIYPVQSGSHPFANFRPPACRNPSPDDTGHGTTYCDAMEFTVEVPDGYREVYGVGIVLEWENAYHPDDNPAGNQLTLHIWGDDGPAFGGTAGPCPHPRSEDCIGKQPLFFSMVEPLPSTGDVTCPAEDCNRYPVFMTVVNSQGVNLGYKITLHFFELALPPLPEFADPDFMAPAPVQAQATPAPTSPRAEDLVADPGALEPGERPKILVPGPDGELVELEFPALASGRVEDDDGRRINPFITAGILLPLVAALTFLLVRRRRREA